MASGTIYLDHNATTPLLPAAAEAMQRVWETGFANPASQHAPGRDARRILEAARERIISLLGGQSGGMSADRLVFTSGGTEANSLVIRGLLAASNSQRLIISSIEHPSVTATADRVGRDGYRVDRLGVSNDGVIQVEQLHNLLAEADDAEDSVGLVSVMMGSNETGVLQPIEAIAALCREAGVPLHTDAVQVVGKRPINFRELGLAALTFTAHKFHGPLGIGGVLLAPGVDVQPQLDGGFQQASLRPGTESAPLATGMLASLEAADSEQTERNRRMQSQRDRLENALLASWPGAVVVGADSPRLDHTTCIAFPGANRQALVMAYDLAGVACSTGSACASGSSEPSPALVAMGLDSALVEGAVRFSLGALTTDEEIEIAIERIGAVNTRMKRTRAAI